jgi:hypothetical protein
MATDGRTCCSATCAAGASGRRRGPRRRRPRAGPRPAAGACRRAAAWLGVRRGGDWLTEADRARVGRPAGSAGEAAEGTITRLSDIRDRYQSGYMSHGYVWLFRRPRRQVSNRRESRCAAPESSCSRCSTDVLAACTSCRRPAAQLAKPPQSGPSRFPRTETLVCRVRGEGPARRAAAWEVATGKRLWPPGPPSHRCRSPDGTAGRRRPCGRRPPSA